MTPPQESWYNSGFGIAVGKGIFYSSLILAGLIGMGYSEKISLEKRNESERIRVMAESQRL